MSTTIGVGAVFGAALTASGVYQPAVILSQLRLENWQMLQAFLTATAVTALIATASQRLSGAQLKPRGYASYGWFARYDGNLVGGALLGAGMALSAACPGTVLSQAALGIRAGYFALAGGLLAGVAWTGLPLSSSSSSSLPAPSPPAALTVHEALGAPRWAVLVSFEALCGASVAGTTLLCAPSPYARLPPVAGGLLIAAAQFVSVLSRRSLIGVSGAFEEAGGWFWWLLSPSSSKSDGETGKAQKPKPKTTSLLFAVGIVLGTRAVAAAFPSLVRGAVADVSPAAAFAGGFVMVFGSRMAGGCTSGHGISGVSLLSVSSVVTIASALVGGALTALYLIP